MCSIFLIKLEKVNLLNQQCFCQNNKMFSRINSCNTCSMLSFGIDTAPQSFCHSFTALPMIRLFELTPRNPLFRCVKLWCKVVTVVMETTQLVLSQFKNFLS